MTTIQGNGEAAFGDAVWELPHLILHPFTDRASTERLVENSRQALAAMLPGSGACREDFARHRQESHCAEIRMLFYLGRDITRWMGQCVELAARVPELAGAGVQEQSFGDLLTRHMPPAVGQKLQGWGVHNAAAIFARAIGLNQIFAEPPALDGLGGEFVRHYHHYADAMHACWQRTAVYREITGANFHFELYASGEYTKMLESEWGTA